MNCRSLRQRPILNMLLPVLWKKGIAEFHDQIRLFWKNILPLKQYPDYAEIIHSHRRFDEAAREAVRIKVKGERYFNERYHHTDNLLRTPYP